MLLIFVLVLDNASLALAVLQRFAFTAETELISALLYLIEYLFIFSSYFQL